MFSVWSPWAEFGECTVSCGGGVIARTRTCNVGDKHTENSKCKGEATEEAVCNGQICPSKDIL